MLLQTQGGTQAATSVRPPQSAQDFGHAYDWAGSLLPVSLTAALVSMAVIQMVKDLTRVRGLFHRRQTTTWFGPKGVLELIQLAAPGQPRLESVRKRLWVEVPEALFDLPIEQLCGQLSAAAQIALEQPREHASLLRALALGVDSSDIDRLTKPAQTTQAGGPEPNPDGLMEEELAARNRVDFQIQRTIDAFQIATASLWKLRLQLAAILLSLLTCLLGTAYGGDGLSWGDVGFSVAAGLVGGFLAPIAHDLLSGLRRLGRRRE